MLLLKGVLSISYSENIRNLHSISLKFYKVEWEKYRFRFVLSLREKWRYSEFFWSVFSRFRTEYRVLLCEIRTRRTPKLDTYYAVNIVTLNTRVLWVYVFGDHVAILQVGQNRKSTVLKPVKLVLWFAMKHGSWCHVFMLFSSPDLG